MLHSEPPRPLLEMRGISKTFPGVRALDNVSLTVYPGEVHSLMSFSRPARRASPSSPVSFVSCVATKSPISV